MKNHKNYILDYILLILLFLYYLYFVNKGIDFGDEGYYVHIASRIAQGQIPYRDFALQYTPGFFYILAIGFKFFGYNLLVGRIINIFVCVLTVIILFKILHKRQQDNLMNKIIATVTYASFSYPLINISIAIWIVVLLVHTLIFILLSIKNQYRIAFFLLLGLVCTLTILFKQNIGVAFTLLTSVFILLESQHKIRSFLYFLIGLLFTTGLWMVPLFYNNSIGLYEFIGFSRKFVNSFAFSYPSPFMITQPFGFFKLLPYYLPIIFLLYLVIKIIVKKFNYENDISVIYFLIGYFVTLYPATDLLHIYPFLGPLVVCFFLISDFSKLIRFAIVTIFIGIGFYLTFFKEYYRYYPGYKYQIASLSMPSAQYVKTTPPTAQSLNSLYSFSKRTFKKDEKVICYPSCPLVYFLLNVDNASGDSIYFPIKTAAVYKESRVLSEIRKKNVRYIITYGNYILITQLSTFIQNQKRIYKDDQFAVFQIVR